MRDQPIVVSEPGGATIQSAGILEKVYNPMSSIVQDIFASAAGRNFTRKKFGKGEITVAWWYEQIAGTYLADSVSNCKTRIGKYGIIPLLELGIWTLSPFSLRCYLAILRKRIGRAIKGD